MSTSSTNLFVKLLLKRTKIDMICCYYIKSPRSLFLVWILFKVHSYTRTQGSFFGSSFSFLLSSVDAALPLKLFSHGLNRAYCFSTLLDLWSTAVAILPSNIFLISKIDSNNVILFPRSRPLVIWCCANKPLQMWVSAYRHSEAMAPNKPVSSPSISTPTSWRLFHRGKPVAGLPNSSTVDGAKFRQNFCATLVWSRAVIRRALLGLPENAASAWWTASAPSNWERVERMERTPSGWRNVCTAWPVTQTSLSQFTAMKVTFQY